MTTFWDKITKTWKFLFSGLRNVQKTTTKMNVSAHGDGNAAFHFFARMIDIAKEKQWFGDPSRAPQPHEPHRHPYHCFSLAISMIMAKKWNVAFSSSPAETFIFVVKYWRFRRRKYQHSQFFVILSQKLTISALKRLSDWMAAWRFRKSSPTHQIWSGN